MITTRFGSEVKILSVDAEGWAKLIRVEDNAEREWHVSELRYSDDSESEQLLPGYNSESS